MAEPTDWNKDIPWLGAWIPLVFALVAIGALLVWIGIPLFVLMIVGPFVILAVYLYLWGPKGRFTSSPDDEAPSDETT